MQQVSVDQGLLLDENGRVLVVAGTGGSGFDYKQQADPGTVGAGKTWLRLPPNIAPDTWQANSSYGGGAYVVPTVANGHYYITDSAGTSGGTEPTPWPTNGGTGPVDGTTAWDDLGLLGPIPGAEWSLYRRNDANSGWAEIGPTTGYGTQSRWEVFYPNGQDAATITLATGGIVLDMETAEGNRGSRATVGTTGVALVGNLGVNGHSPVAQSTAIADATSAGTVITQLNLLLAYLRSRGDIAP